MRKLQYRIVDVFTDRMFGGNPLAVFLDGRGLSDTEMQALAREMNLSETTFVLPPDDPANDFRVRIFTPRRELPMAGHPTVGTAFVLAREKMLPAGGDPLTIRLEEKVGVIPVRLEMKEGAPSKIWMTQPRPSFGPVFPGHPKRPANRGGFVRHAIRLRAGARSGDDEKIEFQQRYLLSRARFAGC
jgi:trans-2,3-dihydro-3-hydroxyanthranilate isomerase